MAGIEGRLRTLYGVLLFVGTVGIVGYAANLQVRAAMRAGEGAGNVPGSPRLAGEAAVFPQIVSVRAFAPAGNRLYLLDALDRRVHVLLDTAGSLRYLAGFSRAGGGPGELTEPSGIAYWPDSSAVVIVDGGRLHLFDVDGRYRRSIAPRYPCVLPQAQAGTAAHGVFVYGDCTRRGPPDTLAAVLLWSLDGRTFRLVASDARLALDGTFGHIHGTRSAFTAGGGHHLFGAGVAPCLYRITESSAAPAARRVCDVSPGRIPLHLSDATLAQLRRRPRAVPSERQRIPSEHPAYRALLTLGREDFLLRSFSEDSLVLRRSGSAADLAVLPMAGLIGCDAAGCLRTVPREDGTLVVFYRSEALRATAMAGAR